MQLKPFRLPGSTKPRRAFWDDVYEIAKSCRKVAGRNITINEFPGSGTIINADRKSTPGGNPCEDPEASTVTLHVTGVVSCPGVEWVDVNGTWVLPIVSSGSWLLEVEFINPDPPFDSFAIDFAATCGLDDLGVDIFSGGAFWFSGIDPAPGPVTNLRTCAGGDAGEDGTATLAP